MFSPKGDKLAVAASGGPVTIYDTSTGDVLREFQFDPVLMKFSADGTRLLTVSTEKTKLLDLSTGKEAVVQWQIPIGHVGYRLKIQSGKLLFDEILPGGPAAESGKLKVGDELLGMVVRGEFRRFLGKPVADAMKEVAGPPGAPLTLRVSPKGGKPEIDVTLKRAGGTLVQNQIQFQKAEGNVTADGCVLKNSGQIVVLNANNGNVAAVFRSIDLEKPELKILSLDGRHLAIASQSRIYPQAPCGLEIFDVAKQERTQFATLGEDTLVHMRYSPDGKQLLLGRSDRVEFYDVEKRSISDSIVIDLDPLPDAPEPTGEIEFDQEEALKRAQRKGTERIYSFDISPDGKLLAVGTNHVQCLIWSTQTRKCVAKIGERNPSGIASHVQFSPNGRWLTYYDHGTLHIMNLKEVLPPGDNGSTTNKTDSATK